MGPLSILMVVVTINILVKLQLLVEVNRLVRRSVLLLPDEQDESEEARKTSKKIKNEIVILLFFSLKRNLHDLWKIKMRPYLTEKRKKKSFFFWKKKKKKKKKKK